MWQLSSNVFDIEKVLLEESLFCVGNGYVGTRGCLEEAPELISDTIRGSYINGFYDRVPILYGESAFGFPTIQDKQPRIMDTQTLLIFLDGERVIPDSVKIRDYFRVLDFRKGISARGYTYKTVSGKEARIIFKRLASFEVQNLFSYEVEVAYEGHIKLLSVMNADVSNHSDDSDPRVASGHEKLLTLKRLHVQEDVVCCEMETVSNGLDVAVLVAHDGIQGSGDNCTVEFEPQSSRLTAKISGFGQLRLHKKCIFADGTRTPHVVNTAWEAYYKVNKQSFEELMKSQEAYLNGFWEKSDIEIFGAPKLQAAVRFQLFQLLQSVGRDKISNISAKGLSGEGYEGHYFWDTEIYVLPLLQLSQKELAKQLLLYRYHILPQAKERAKQLGHKKGAAYPWRTISGIECSSYFPAGTAQYHLNADIAYSFIQYHLYHRDMRFMLEVGAEVIFETGRIWLEIGHWHQGEFRIDGVTGPDEYTAIVNNNYYTNVMAKYHLKWACKLYQELLAFDPEGFTKLCNSIRLTLEEVRMMQKASEDMYLPYNEELGIDAQDDSFLQKAVWDFAGTAEEQYPLLLHFHPLTIYRYQVLKQADTVLAHFLLEDDTDFDTMKRSFDYYEKVTTHDSSLSSCIHSIMASKCGYGQKAFDYFMESLVLDLEDTHGNTKDGLHMANLAGSCLCVINGFAGYRIKEAGICIAPLIPQGMSGYRFKSFYQGSWLEIEVQEQLRLRLLEGNPVKLKVYGEEYIISDSLVLERRKNE